MNRKLLTLACVLAIALLANCAAQSKPQLLVSIQTLTTNDQLHEWITYYYLHPRPDLVVSGIRFMTVNEWFSKPASRPALAAFLAEILRQNTQTSRIWVSDLAMGPEDQKEFLAMAIWMAENDDSADLLKLAADSGSPAFQQYVRTSLKEHPPKLLEDEITTPGFLDELWGSFLASGDQRYVQRVISALPLLQATDDARRMLIGGAAKWSLTSNAAQHPKVMAICRAELKRVTGRERETIEEVIRGAEKGDN